jgi:hypothetical protein
MERPDDYQSQKVEIRQSPHPIFRQYYKAMYISSPISTLTHFPHYQNFKNNPPIDEGIQAFSSHSTTLCNERDLNPISRLKQALKSPAAN